MMSDHGTADHGHAERAEADHGSHGVGKYIVVFIALCVLTSGSFFTYSDLWPYHHTPEVGWAFMMAVSCSKAALVMLFFMHLKYEADWKYVLTIPASIMAVFLTLALVPDIGLRMNSYSSERKEYIGSEAVTIALEEASAAAAEHEAHGEHGSPPAKH